MIAKLSVIVPIYNVEKYLDKCLASLVNQTMKEIEIICVNDGSTDHSQDIVEEYQKKFPGKIIGLMKKNGGLADARNYGLAHANGDYVAFIDSDDWVEADMFKVMYQQVVKKQADVVVCDMEYVYESGETKFVPGGEFTETNVSNDPLIITINNSACNKLFKRSLFDDVKFPKGLWYEDLGCVPIVLAKANKIVKVNHVFYNYFQRAGSIMHTPSDKIFDIYRALDLVKSYVVKNKIPCLDEVNYMFVEHGAKLTTQRIREYQNGREVFLNQNITTLSSKYPKWIKNKYINTYSKKEKVLMYLLYLRQFKLVLWLYDRK